LIYPPHLRTAATLPWGKINLMRSSSKTVRQHVARIRRSIYFSVKLRSSSLWTASLQNSRDDDLNAVDCQIWGVMHDRVSDVSRDVADLKQCSTDA